MLTTIWYFAYHISRRFFTWNVPGTWLNVQLSLWVLRLGVTFIARADLLPMDDMLATLKEVVGEEVANRMETLDLRRASDRVGTTQSDLNRQVKVYGNAYEDLAEFVKEEEKQIAAKMTHVVGITVPTGEERSFERDMVFASRVDSSTGEVELAWVRRDNKNAWETSVGSMVPGPAP